MYKSHLFIMFEVEVVICTSKVAVYVYIRTIILICMYHIIEKDESNNLHSNFKICKGVISQYGEIVQKPCSYAL